MGNPFQERPSTSRVNSAVASSVEKAMQELDGEHNMPENLDPELWKRFIFLRTQKVEREQMVSTGGRCVTYLSPIIVTFIFHLQIHQIICLLKNLQLMIPFSVLNDFLFRITRTL